MKEKKEGWMRTLLGYAGGYRKKFGLSVVLHHGGTGSVFLYVSGHM